MHKILDLFLDGKARHRRVSSVRSHFYEVLEEAKQFPGARGKSTLWYPPVDGEVCGRGHPPYLQERTQG